MRLRARVGARSVRVSIGQDGYDFQRASFDSAGVAFDIAGQEGVPRWVGGEKLPPAPLASPVGWDRIDRIAVRSGGSLRGAFTGALILGAAIMAYAASQGALSDGMGTIAAMAYTGTGIVLGGGVGAVVGAFSAGSLKTVWERPASPAAP